MLGSQYGLNVPKLNKYEAVLIVDANGASSGVMPLSNGQYQVVVLNKLRDMAGNPLLGIGPQPNGNLMSGIIYVTLPPARDESGPAALRRRAQVTQVHYRLHGQLRRLRRRRRLRRGLDRHQPRHQGVWASCTTRLDAQPAPRAARRPFPCCRSSIRRPANPGPTTRF